VSELDRILAAQAVRAHFQPIVSLEDGGVVGYEALARGPRGSSLEFPDKLFAEARGTGQLAELDTECQRAAFAGAAGQLEPPAALFVNVEPASFVGPPALEAPGVTVIVEITERGLATQPAELLLAVENVRRRGWGIAVDDLGADWRSLALLPFLRPDVVKLDRAVLADPADPDAARTVRGARAHLARHGGRLLAEGIEDEWTVIVVGPHSALALIARDLGDSGPDAERRFEYVVSEDRELILRAGRALMLRVAAEPRARPAFRTDLAGSGEHGSRSPHRTAAMTR